MIYLDNAATTAVKKSALDAALPFFSEQYGNPSSGHFLGRKAAIAVLEAREKCAAALSAQPREIIFTSGGTESNNMALRLAERLGRRRIVTTAMEHHSVLEKCRELSARGFEVVYLQPDSEGHISAEQAEKALTADTGLMSIMTANNEVGSIQPIAEIGEICRRHGVLFHTDAVQAVGNIDIDVKRMNIDLLSCSAHKLGGFKGSGLLYCANGIDLQPLIYGGGQERGLRSGTENVAAIVALGAAITDSCRDIAGKQAKIAALRERLTSQILQIPQVCQNGGGERLCGIANFSFEGIEGESLVLSLDLAGICCSSGSACSGGNTAPSHVITAMGLGEERARSSLRFSLNENNSMEEIDKAAQVTALACARIRCNNTTEENNEKKEN